MRLPLKGVMFAAALALGTPTVFAAFGITTVWDSNLATRPQYIVDTEGGLVFKIRGYDNGASTTSAGDISSMVYNGVEYAQPANGTQLNSGADNLYTAVSAVDVKAELVAADGTVTPASTANNGFVAGSDFVRITLTVNSTLGGQLKHYYMAKRGQPVVFMGTWFTEEPSVHGLARFIARVPIAVLPNAGPAGVPGGLVTGGGTSTPYWPEDLRGTGAAIEASDVFGFPTTDPRYGQSRSKHYSNMRLKDWKFFGGTNAAGTAGLWFYRDNNEGNSGGPFYRSLLQQVTSTTNELTYIINYGEGQTEGFRLGTLNTYALVFNNGSAPTEPDTSWQGLMGMQGYVAPQQRGAVSVPAISGRVAAYPYTVGFANAKAQYWADVDPADGHVTATGLIPGDYTMTVYKGELGVQTASVSVSAGATTTLGPVAITADPSATSALWRIGDFDGTPLEFINGNKLTVMHPSDVRMASFIVPPYVIGSSQPGTHFPAYQWKDLNSPLTIRFTLTRTQQRALTKGVTLRVGITADYNSARPVVTLNGWTSTVPAAPPKVSRNLTVGTYRGVNRLYTFAVPAAELVAGTNSVTIAPASGTAGTAFLSPGYSFDAVDLIPTP